MCLKVLLSVLLYVVVCAVVCRLFEKKSKKGKIKGRKKKREIETEKRLKQKDKKSNYTILRMFLAARGGGRVVGLVEGVMEEEVVMVENGVMVERVVVGGVIVEVVVDAAGCHESLNLSWGHFTVSNWMR